jgi:hypothetical protein
MILMIVSCHASTIKTTTPATQNTTSSNQKSQILQQKPHSTTAGKKLGKPTLPEAF